MRSFNVDRNLLDREIIRIAIQKVCKNKHKKNGRPTRKYIYAQRILANLDKYVDKTYDMVEAYIAVKEAEARGEKADSQTFAKAFKPSPQKFFTVVCDNGKVRDIASVPIFPDQVMHQLLVMVAEKYFMRGMYAYSCGSIPGRGVHYGKRYLERSIKRAKRWAPSELKYAAQLDIKKCYPHVRHAELKAAIRKKFRGNIFVSLCYDIIDSYNEAAPDEAPRGLPIGFYTSQWFCNFLLTPLDHTIKERLKVKIYARNMDDMVMFHRNKKELHAIVRAISEEAGKYGLQLKENWQVFRFDYIDKRGKNRGRVPEKHKKRALDNHKGRALDVLGFRFYRDRIILRRRLALGIRRAVARMSKKFKAHRRITLHEARSLMSRLGGLRHCNSLGFYEKYIKPLLKIKKVKEIIRNEIRINSNARCAV